MTITAVSARDPKKNRDADLSAYAWETDPVALARRCRCTRLGTVVA